jgi:hypothetical protein
MSKDHEFVCKECGFTVPCDNIGVALMEAHLRDKHKEADIISLAEEDNDDDEGG